MNKLLLATSKSKFSLWVALICLSYLIIQLCFIPYARFSLDDLWLAYHTYHYKTALPYRDFPPYKTVLGYYIFLLPMLLFKGVLSPLFYTKVWIALINTAFLAGVATRLKKLFAEPAILISLALVVYSQLFIYYSVEIRVDVLSYWLCLVSVILLLEEKYLLAGISMGLGFMICQKVVWYLIATNCGFVGYYLLNDRHWRMIKNLFSFNIAALLLVSLYIIFWSYFSSFNIVLRSLFYEAYLISSVDWYTGYLTLYWHYIIGNNPGYCLLWPLALFGLIILPAKKRVFVIIYTSVLLYFVISCQQPFYYFPLVAMPALIILYASFLTASFSVEATFSLTKNQKILLMVFSCIYVVGLLLLFCTVSFPDAYLMIGLVPLILCAWQLSKINAATRAVFSSMLILILSLIGFVIPVLCFINNMPSMNGRYQQSMIPLVANLLKDDDSYIAGVPLLLDVDQTVPGLVHLVGPTIDYITHPSKKLYPIMTLRSLYFDPVTVADIIESIKKTPVKLYVDNDRFHLLPKELHAFLDTQYQHYWGSIFLYAPEIQAGTQTITIKFTGQYQLKSTASIALNQKMIQPGATVLLNKGQYQSEASTIYRLVFMPENVDHLLEPQFKENHWRLMLF